MIFKDFCQAKEILIKGNVVAVPTETVYGLAANALSDEAVAKIYALKKRPAFNPLICHVPSLESAQKYGDFNETALKLAQTFWPGPLTLIVKQKETAGISKLATCGLQTVGLRVPNHKLMQKLLTAIDFPLAAPSANASGLLSPTKPDHVIQSLGDIPVLDGGSAHVGLESTIVDVSGDIPALLRPGMITLDDLQKIVPSIIQKTTHEAINAPGQLPSHYAPRLPLRLNAGDALNIDEAFLAFGPITQIGYKVVLNLSEEGNMLQAAANLFAYLHQLDCEQYSGIAIAPIPTTGIGLAINDRLNRAAHG